MCSVCLPTPKLSTKGPQLLACKVSPNGVLLPSLSPTPSPVCPKMSPGLRPELGAWQTEGSQVSGDWMKEVRKAGPSGRLYRSLCPWGLGPLVSKPLPTRRQTTQRWIRSALRASARVPQSRGEAGQP